MSRRREVVLTGCFLILLLLAGSSQLSYAETAGMGSVRIGLTAGKIAYRDLDRDDLDQEESTNIGIGDANSGSEGLAPGVTLGIVLTSKIEVGARVLFDDITVEDDTGGDYDATGYQLVAYFDYNFGSALGVRPFLGGLVGYSSYDSDWLESTGYLLGVHGGIKLFLSPNSSIDITAVLDYGQYDLDWGAIDDSADSLEFEIEFGISIWL